MTIHFQTGFDHYTTILQRWSSSAGNGSFSNTITASAGRFSTNGLELACNSPSAFNIISKNLASNLSTFYQAFAYKTNNLAHSGGIRPIWRGKDLNTNQVELGLNVASKLVATRDGTILGTSYRVLLANVFYHIEIKCVISDTVGQFIVRINEIVDSGLNLTGIDTKNSGNAYITSISLENSSQGSTTGQNTTTFDDVILRDDGWSGDATVTSYFPISVGSTDNWTPIGAATTALATDETAPNSDTDYMTASTVSFLSLFNYNTIRLSSTIQAVVPIPFVRKTDAGSAQVASTILIGGTNYTGANQAPSTNYEYFPEPLLTSPATGVTWTATEWNSIQIGTSRTA